MRRWRGHLGGGRARVATPILAAATLLLWPGAVLGGPLAVEAVDEGIYYHHWSNSVQTIVGGAAIKFANPYGTVPHGLKFTGGSAGATPTCTGIPAAAEQVSGATSWQGECTFTKPGTYTFICTVHPSEMTGTITVTNGEPTVSTGSATAVGEGAATLNGEVNPEGKATKYFFKWGPTATYGQTTSVPAAIEGSAEVPVSASLAGLQPGTTYHYRLVAENEKGSAEGADRSFTTLSPPGPPNAVTDPPSAVGETSAMLAGTVDPNGQATEYFFEWGLTSAYDRSTETLPLAAQDRSAHAVTAMLGGLLAGTVYHYRLVAKNASEQVAGVDREFTTTATPPAKEPSPSPGPTPQPGPLTPEPSVPLVESSQPAPPGAQPTPSLVAGSLRLSGHGSGVRGSIRIGSAMPGGHLQVELLAPPGALGERGSRPVVVGRFARGSLAAGTVAFTVSLTPRARVALRRRHRLAVTAKLTLTGSGGASTVLTRALALRV